jgi:predicted DNA-binding transcriptional regulator AlpA
MRSKGTQKKSLPVTGEFPQKLLSTSEVAALLGVSPMTLRIWRVSGRGVGLGYVKVGPRIVRYEPSEIARFLRSRRMTRPAIERAARYA